MAGNWALGDDLQVLSRNQIAAANALRVPLEPRETVITKLEDFPARRDNRKTLAGAFRQHAKNISAMERSIRRKGLILGGRTCSPKKTQKQDNRRAQPRDICPPSTMADFKPMLR